MNAPKEVLETSKDNNWKSCLFCGGEIIQVRKALFTCLKCNQEYIADEEDMRDEIPTYKIKKIKDTDFRGSRKVLK